MWNVDEIRAFCVHFLVAALYTFAIEAIRGNNPTYLWTKIKTQFHQNIGFRKSELRYVQWQERKWCQNVRNTRYELHYYYVRRNVTRHNMPVKSSFLCPRNWLIINCFSQMTGYAVHKKQDWQCNINREWWAAIGRCFICVLCGMINTP